MFIMLLKILLKSMKISLHISKHFLGYGIINCIYIIVKKFDKQINFIRYAAAANLRLNHLSKAQSVFVGKLNVRKCRVQLFILNLRCAKSAPVGGRYADKFHVEVVQ